MNHYPHHIGDYLKDTAHLDPLEDGIYRRMIDLYYTQEGPLSNDIERLCRRIRVDIDKHGATVRDLLNEFFKPTETGWVQERCERELSDYKDRAEIARQNGARGGRPRKNPENPTLSDAETNSVISGFSKITHEKANQNQNQNHIKSRASRKTSIPKDFEVSERVKQWALEKGHHSLQAHFENFVSAAKAKGYTYVDWDEALMKAIRDNWAKVPPKAEQRRVAL